MPAASPSNPQVGHTVDDLGHPYSIPATPVQRVVSLVPSLTEALASVNAAALVGVTDWCTHPPELDTARVRGTKNPNLDAIIALEPEVVIANQEENRELDVTRLRQAGIAVWVSVTESVPQALAAMERIFTTCLAWPIPGWLLQATRLWTQPVPPVELRVATPIWRDPWMVVGGGTFTNDLLRRLGIANVCATTERYPHMSLEEIIAAGPDVVLLPDEPYEFTAADGPEAFPDTPTVLLPGRLLTWYGPSLLTAHEQVRPLVGLDPL